MSMENASPFDGVEWDDDGFPKFWSVNAREIARSKYFRPIVGDRSLRDLITRVAGSVRRAGQWQGYFDGEEAARAFEHELSALFLHQKAAFNSPAWFNLGVFPMGGVAGESENWAWDRAADHAVKTTTAYIRPQVSACFIQNIEDNLINIYNLLKSEARLFKFGSGTGTNFSRLRSKWEHLELGGTSCGVLSYLEIFDKSAQAIKSGGTSRRAAKMVILDADHPEIEDFVTWKAREERKARVLIANGYQSGFEGEAYRTVSGQNSNNSVRVSDEFLESARTGGEWHLHARTDGRVVKKIPAAALWEQMAKAAWECADPGLQFADTINRWHMCPDRGEIRACNPCSEFMFIDDSACNLASINLLAYLTKDGDFDFTGFERTVEILILAQDILVDYASYPTREICENSHQLRPLGLGYANLGGLLMSLGVPYDSEAAFAWTTLITATLHAKALETSARLAQRHGAFEGCSRNKDHIGSVLNAHADVWKQRQPELHQVFVEGDEARKQMVALDWLWRAVGELNASHGLRNAQVTLLAPTGTIGLFMDCDTLGIEPDYALTKIKTLVGGGSLKLVNQSLGRGLRRLGYTSEQAARIVKYAGENNTVVGAPELTENHYAIFDTALAPRKHPERRISARGHLRIMQAAQGFLSGGISKTVNLPANTSVEEVKAIYLEAWELGLKSIAIYRDGSKSFQPLCLDC